MTFAFMLLAGAFALCAAGALGAFRDDDLTVRGALAVAAGLVALGTVILGTSWHWHNLDFHPEDQPVAEEAWVVP